MAIQNAVFLIFMAILYQTGASGQTQTARVPFDEAPLGSAPAGWKVEATHPGSQLAEWSVREDARATSGKRVLAVRPTASERSTYNLAWSDQVRFGDGVIEVKVRAGDGHIDQGGGPIWRVRDANNYYIARWNPLENNFRVYYVKDGRRVQLDTADVNVPADQWHTIRVEQQGNHITCYLDGTKLLEAEDSTLPESGGVGLWTKADAASFFDDLVVQAK